MAAGWSTMLVQWVPHHNGFCVFILEYIAQVLAETSEVVRLGNGELGLSRH